MGWLGQRVRIALVVIAGIGLFIIDVAEGYLPETGIDDLLSLVMAGLAFFLLYWKATDNTLRTKSWIIIGLYLLLTLADLALPSGSRLDELMGFMVTFVAVPLTIWWGLVRRLAFGRSATT